MQFGQRTQNASSSKSRPRRNPSLVVVNAVTGDMDTAPKSNARMEAEAAFAAPRFTPTPSSQAQITVRRARIALLPNPVVTEADHHPQPVLASKSPRVFRVEAAHAADSELQARSSPLSTPRDGTRSETPKPYPKRPPRRHVADKRPGPVVHLIQAMPSRPEHRAATAQPAVLNAALASLDLVLQDIERAQSWVFIEERFGSDWQALSRRISALRAELHAPQPWRV